MNSVNVEKLIVPMAALFLALGVAQPASANWILDFEEPLPPTVDTRSFNESDVASPTYTTNVGDGILTLGDSSSTDDDGAHTGLLWHEEEFTDVRVTGTINPTGDSSDFIFLASRSDADLSNGYRVAFSFRLGTLFIFQVANDRILSASVSSDDVNQGSQPPLTDLSRSYFLENQVIGNEITGRLYDVPGGTELLTVSFVDSRPFARGISGLGAFKFPSPTSEVLSASFDDVRSVAIPEPGSIILLFLGCLPVVGSARRRRSVPPSA